MQLLAVLEERVQQMLVADLLQLVHRSPSLSSFRGLRFARRSIDGRDVVLQLVSHLLLFLQQGLHVVYLLRLQLHGDRHHGLYSLFIGKDVDFKCFGFLAAASTAARSKPKANSRCAPLF